MSHSDEPIVCPNCGFKAINNYCSQCGQETHLHKETFWGLVMHFVGDYFHYDSKFWKTMKALWFSPGKLTIAYWNKQRMQYIKPVSLYIFISAVYFLLSFSAHDELVAVHATTSKGVKFTTSNVQTDSIPPDSAAHSRFDKFITNKFRKIDKTKGGFKEFLNEKIVHDFPKVFFCMIPIMGILLKLLFIRRKNLYFVDHVIFALHYHSFWFSLLMPANLHFHGIIKQLFYVIFSLIAAYYMVKALRNVYKISRLRAVLGTMFLAVSYIILLSLTLFSYMLVVVALA